MASTQCTNCIKRVSEEIQNEVVCSKLPVNQPAEIWQNLEELSNGYVHTTQDIISQNLLPLRSGTNGKRLSVKIPNKILTNNAEDTKSPTSGSTDSSADAYSIQRTTSKIKQSHSQGTVSGLVETLSTTATCDAFVSAVTARQKMNSSPAYVVSCHSRKPFSLDKNSSTSAKGTATTTGHSVPAFTSTPEYKPEGDPSCPATLEEDLSCGYGSCKPSYIQMFNTPTAILVFLCVANFVKGKEKINPLIQLIDFKWHVNPSGIFYASS